VETWTHNSIGISCLIKTGGGLPITRFRAMICRPPPMPSDPEYRSPAWVQRRLVEPKLRSESLEWTEALVVHTSMSETRSAASRAKRSSLMLRRSNTAQNVNTQGKQPPNFFATILNLEPGVRYRIQLLAENEVGPSEMSEETIEYVTDTTTPDRCRKLTCKRPTEFVCLLRWTAYSSGGMTVDHYDIQYTQRKLPEPSRPPTPSDTYSEGPSLAVSLQPSPTPSLVSSPRVPCSSVPELLAATESVPPSLDGSDNVRIRAMFARCAVRVAWGRAQSHGNSNAAGKRKGRKLRVRGIGCGAESAFAPSACGVPHQVRCTHALR
jgi:hypothetical protein